MGLVKFLAQGSIFYNFFKHWSDLYKFLTQGSDLFNFLTQGSILYKLLKLGSHPCKIQSLRKDQNTILQNLLINSLQTREHDILHETTENLKPLFRLVFIFVLRIFYIHKELSFCHKLWLYICKLMSETFDISNYEFC